MFKQSVMGCTYNLPHAHRGTHAPGASINPKQPRGTKGTTTRLTIAGNRKFDPPPLLQSRMILRSNLPRVRKVP